MSTTISSKVYDFIRGKFLSGQLSPGARISEFAIAKELKVSRSPIREAISQLVSDGLVEKYHGFGAFVKVPDRRDIEELFVLREMLECYAVTEAARHISPCQVDRLSRYCDEILSIAKKIQLEPDADLTEKIVQADMGFHLLIMEYADNRQILKIIENCRILTTIFSMYNYKQLGLKEVADIWREHFRIKQAISRHDAETACEWMKKQIQRSRRLVLSNYENLLREAKRLPFKQLGK